MAGRAKTGAVIVCREPIRAAALHAAIGPSGCALGEEASEPIGNEGFFFRKAKIKA